MLFCCAPVGQRRFLVVGHTVLTWLRKIITSTWLQRWSFNSPKHLPRQRHPISGAQTSVTALKTWNLVSFTLWKCTNTHLCEHVSKHAQRFECMFETENERITVKKKKITNVKLMKLFPPGCLAFWCLPCFTCITTKEAGQCLCLPLLDCFGLIPPATMSLRASLRYRYGIKVGTNRTHTCLDSCLFAFFTLKLRSFVTHYSTPTPWFDVKCYFYYLLVYLLYIFMWMVSFFWSMAFSLSLPFICSLWSEKGWNIILSMVTHLVSAHCP